METFCQSHFTLQEGEAGELKVPDSPFNSPGDHREEWQLFHPRKQCGHSRFLFTTNLTNLHELADAGFGGV